MPVFVVSYGDALEEKIADLEANGHKVVAAFGANESACVVFTQLDGRRKRYVPDTTPFGGVETR